MRLSRIRHELIAEKRDKHFFDYKDLSNDMWRDKVKEAQDKYGVHFDLENDYDVAQREIEVDQDEWEHFSKVKFRCELFSAGGDWENPVLYFRCQLFKGYARDLSQGDHFIYIPSQGEGNTSLVKGKDGWHASDNSDTTKDESKPNQYKAWQGLKKYLQKLVKDKIAENRKDG